MDDRPPFKLAALVILTALSPPAWAGGHIRAYEAHPLPSTPAETRSVTRWFGCTSIYDGKALDCNFSLTLTGLKEPATEPLNNGGHLHAAGRPLVLNDGALEYPADADPAPLSVEGKTLSTPPFHSARVVHNLPTAAGKLATDAYLVAPPGWICVSGCYTRTSWRYQIDYDVGVQGLMSLPDDETVYSKVRSDDNNHPNGVAYYGTPLSLQMIRLVAENYFVYSGRMLSVNDMSLPKGGLFDIKGNWSTPHKSHREGRDADINRGRVPCSSDTELRQAVDRFLAPVPTVGGGTRSALLCETNNNDSKHIDFEAPAL